MEQTLVIVLIVAGVALGAVLMIAPGFVGLVGHPMAAIALLAIGGFAHQVISVLINTLSADVFPQGDIAKANGLVGMAGGIGGFYLASTLGLAKKMTGSYQSGFIGFALLALFALVALFSLKARWRAIWPTLHGDAATVRV